MVACQPQHERHGGCQQAGRGQAEQQQFADRLAPAAVVEQPARQPADQQHVQRQRHRAEREHVERAPQRHHAREQQQHGDAQRIVAADIAREQRPHGGAGDHRGGQRRGRAVGPGAGTREAAQQRAERHQQQHGRTPADGVRGKIVRLDAPAVASVRMHPQRHAGHRDKRPRRPQHVAARGQRQRQRQRRPQREELPGVGAGLVGLAEVGEEAADGDQRQQRQRRASGWAQQGAERGHQHQALQQREAPGAADVVPVGGDPAHQPDADQRRRQHRHPLRQPAGEARGFAAEPGAGGERLRGRAAQPMSCGQFVQGKSCVQGAPPGVFLSCAHATGRIGRGKSGCPQMRSGVTRSARRV